MTDPLLRFFDARQVHEHYRQIVEPFETLASRLVWTLPPNAERTRALYSLLNARDCALRAAIHHGREVAATGPDRWTPTPEAPQ